MFQSTINKKFFLLRIYLTIVLSALYQIRSFYLHSISFLHLHIVSKSNACKFYKELNTWLVLVIPDKEHV